MKAASWLPHTATAYAGASAALLIVALAFDTALTRSMALHMLLHIPLILSSGIFAGAALSVNAGPAPWRRAWRLCGKYNEYGVPGLLLAAFVAAYWMIPKSLDDVLLFPAAAAGKYLGLFIAGVALFDSLRRANNVIKLFFLGNFSWMSAIAGLIYQEETTRLCNVYLLSDQELAGRGLVVLALAVPGAWLLSEWARMRRLMSK